MLAGLMGATLLSGIAPAYAQSNPEQRGQRGGERAARAEAGVAVSRGNRMNQPRGDGPTQSGPTQNRPTQRWQQRPAERPAPPMAPRRPEVRPDNRPQQRPEQWRGDRNQPNRGLENAARDRQQRAQNWRDQQQRQENRPDWRNNRPDDRRDGRNDGQDWRNDRRDDRQNGRQDWRNDRRDNRQDWRTDRQDDRRDWRADRQDDRRWNDNRGRTGNDRTNWNNGRRFDDRTRWANQRRWDNGWRQDRRYDWNSYRNRYGDRYRMGRYDAPRGWNYGYRSFSVGIFLNSLLYSNSYWLNDPYSYRLPPAYGSMRWIRYYDDALLVDIRDGYVVDVINNFFW